MLYIRAYKHLKIGRQLLDGNGTRADHRCLPILRPNMQWSEKKRAVLVYNGEGAGSRSVLSALETLTRSLPELQVCSLPRAHP